MRCHSNDSLIFPPVIYYYWAASQYYIDSDSSFLLGLIGALQIGFALVRCGLLLKTELRGLSVVCLSVSDDCEPCKTASRTVWDVDSGGSKEPCIRWGRVHIGATWRMRLNHPSTAAMRHITLTTCYLWTRLLTRSHRQPSASSRILYCGHSTQYSYLVTFVF